MICFADTEIPSRWKKLTICCPQACRPQAVWNQKVDDADSQLPHHQPIRKMSMGQFAPCNPLPQVSGYYLGFPRCSVVKNPLANAEGAGGADSIPESGRSPGGGNGNPLQYFGWDNPVDRGIWWATVQGVAKSQTRLKDWTCMQDIIYSSWRGIRSPWLCLMAKLLLFCFVWLFSFVSAFSHLD